MYAHGHNGRIRIRAASIDKIVARNTIRCAFCNWCNTVDKETLTCSNCNTTQPRNYGSTQRKDRHGRKIEGVK